MTAETLRKVETHLKEILLLADFEPRGDGETVWHVLARIEREANDALRVLRKRVRS